MRKSVPPLLPYVLVTHQRKLAMQAVKLIILVCSMLFMFYRMCMHNDITKECVQTVFRVD